MSNVISVSDILIRKTRKYVPFAKKRYIFKSEHTQGARNMNYYLKLKASFF